MTDILPSPAPDTIVARWESKSGKWYVVATHDGTGGSFSSPTSGGYLGRITRDATIAEVQRRVDLGHFQPDANRTPMHRVAIEPATAQ